MVLSIEEAREKILAGVEPLEAEEKALLGALGQVLAEDIRSPVSLPPYDSAAMDGYALRSGETRGATRGNPRVLQVIGEITAGESSGLEVRPGTAVRIMTGAPLPSGADAVVQFEDTDEEERRTKGLPLSEVGIFVEVSSGKNVRPVGEDVAQGNLVLRRGTVLRPPEIGLLASLGKVSVKVIRRPVVALLATGNELVEPGQPLPPGKIYNSNTFSLAAQVLSLGAIPKVLGIAPDDPQVISERIAQALDSDLVITSAGVSVGEFDVVKKVLASLGEITFWRVRMKPGKPLAFGRLRKNGGWVPHLGLPGFPVSSMLAFQQFARPLILKLMGKEEPPQRVIKAISESRLENPDGRRVFARVKLRKEKGKYFARLTGPQGSGVLTSLTQADGLLIVPEEVRSIREGDEVLVQILDWGE